MSQLSASGNFRHIPAAESAAGVVDLSSNDYLGLAVDTDLRRDFMRGLTVENFLPSSSASRLLCGLQDDYQSLEHFLQEVYGRPALLFNSGYHANTGMIAALGGKDTLFIADKLVHASIIDGLKLSGSDFKRFRHNDTDHLRALIERYGRDYERLVIVAESVYSMDGDTAPIAELVEAKRLHPNAMLYVDEAHAVGVCGERGLGLTPGLDVDIMVGTFGKALASMGAFAVMTETMRSFMVNRCRSLIFSTALPPLTARWTEHVMRQSLTMDGEREALKRLADRLSAILGTSEASHIQPYIVGDARRTVLLSEHLCADGFKVLPIRTPTVPPGTERLRFSLSAAIDPSQLDGLARALDAARAATDPQNI